MHRSRTRNGRLRPTSWLTTAGLLVVSLLAVTFGNVSEAGAAAEDPIGYWLLSEDGTVYACGDPDSACTKGPSGIVDHYGDGYAAGVEGPPVGLAGFVENVAGGSIVGDDFNANALDTTLWAEVPSALDGDSFNYPGGQAIMSVPGGTDEFQPWTGGNSAPTLRQDLNDEDFDLVAAFGTTPAERFQIQGMVVADDSNQFLRFDVHWDGTEMRAFAADPLMSATPLIDVAVPNSSHATYLRVTRTGDTWELRTSPDGSVWTSHGTFDRTMVVTGLGPFVGNARSGDATTMAPAYSGNVDYFGPLPIPSGALGGQLPAGVTAVAFAPSPSNAGYVILLSDGTVVARGAATHAGDLTSPAQAGLLVAGERPTAISVTSTGLGYWVFTNLGRAVNFGDAVHHGDLPGLGITPDDDVVSSAATGNGGYYMLGADGGVFSFGTATFFGSLPQLIPSDQLACEIVGLVPTPAADGYWLVGCDGGVFAFGGAFFVGSVPGLLGPVQLAADVNGIVAYGGGYLMVAGDGGAFNFGAPFFGSLGAVSLTADIVGIATAGPVAG